MPAAYRSSTADFPAWATKKPHPYNRLARNLHFLSSLQERGVDFVAADMPDANRLTIHIIAAVAESVGRTISENTRTALAAARRGE